MKDIVAKSFKSPLSVDEMVKALQTNVPEVSWGGRESEYDDLYVLGRTADGVKIRILNYEAYDELEVYFPSRYFDERKKAFMARIDAEVLPAIGATEVPHGIAT
jgi:hypothetical protein